jgi:ABC-type antimicrobial peptide transport system permease subunit
MGSIWEYFVTIKAGVLILAASIMLVATVLTIIFKIGKAALRNPVDSLRYE